MVAISQKSCAWCHDMNPVGVRFCAYCDHEASKPRAACRCRQCAPEDFAPVNPSQCEHEFKRLYQEPAAADNSVDIRMAYLLAVRRNPGGGADICSRCGIGRVTGAGCQIGGGHRTYLIDLETDALSCAAQWNAKVAADAERMAEKAAGVHRYKMDIVGCGEHEIIMPYDVEMAAGGTARYPVSVTADLVAKAREIAPDAYGVYLYDAETGAQVARFYCR